MLKIINLSKVKLQAFISVMVIIFLAEYFIMFILQFIKIENTFLEAFLDALLLTIFTAPFIYHFMLKKLILKNEQLLIDLKRKADSLDITALVSETDFEGRITFANEHFCKISGHTESELIGKTHKILNSKKHSKEFWKKAWTTIKDGQIWRGDVCNQAKDGSLYWVDATIFPKKDHLGNIVGFSSVRTNITDRELIKEKLKVIAHEAKELAKSKSLFLANMSHEIRTPMNGVIGMTEILSDTELTDEQEILVRSIKTSGDHLMAVINDILDFSKIEAEKMELDSKSFHLKSFIEDLFYLFSSIASQKHINLTFDIEEKIPAYLTGDIVRIRQVLSNFISNALKFTKKSGEVSVSITLSKNSNAHNKVIHFIIKDNGIGIRKEDQEKLFQAFTQADITTTREFGGTGLGLAICAKLVEKMHGSIELESEFGIGTSMKLILPLQIGTPPAIIKKSALSEGTQNLISNLNKPFILLVEDNIINQKVVSIMLQKLNYNYEIANNGIEALELIKENGTAKYGLIFMDMQMPKMDGVTTSKEILHLYAEQAPPIIAMTANVSREDKQKCLDAGMLNLVSKPIKKQDVKDAIKDYYRDH